MSHFWVLCLFLTGACAYPFDVQQGLNDCINKCLQSLPSPNCSNCIQPPPSGCYCPQNQPSQPLPPLNPGWIQPPIIQQPIPGPGCPCLPNPLPPITEPEGTVDEHGSGNENPLKPIIQKPVNKDCCQRPPFRPWIPNFPIQQYPPPSFPPPNFPPPPNNPTQIPPIPNYPPPPNYPIPNFPNQNFQPPPFYPIQPLPNPNFPQQQCCSGSQSIQGCIICFPMYGPMVCHPFCFGNMQCCNTFRGIGGKRTAESD